MTGHIVTTLPDALHAVLTANELALFRQLGRTRMLGTGKLLFQRGDIGTQMYILVSGAVDLDFGEDLVVKHLGPGEFFGELGLLIGDHARSADAIIAADSELVELDHHDFQKLVDLDPSLVAHFLRRTIVRVVNNEQLLIRQLRRRNHDLEAALDNLYATSYQLNQTEELIRTDELTGLHNRRGLALHLQECRRAGRVPGLGLLLIDCDRFKRVNDEHGHLAGDRVLQNIASVLRSVVREGDLACRLGGDEFCVFVGIGNADELRQLGERIVARVQAELDAMQAVPHICSVSVGMCVVDPAGSWNDWYTRADSALYEAKRLGGNRLHGFETQPAAVA
ncbi:MAG TPA: cyclic nucleotide-binding protein [Xanthomonadaceae bacterium]|nr:cyclic nucleotide-binding protein [Xanthomonadaceae bacterium]